MQFEQTVTLKDGRKCLLRSCETPDAEAVLACFLKTHAETDFLLSYPDECSFTPEQEREFLANKLESACEVEIGAFIDGRLTGTAGLESVGKAEKIRHRATFGISVEREFWGLGIGRALTLSCIECARRAGYAQLELDVVAENSAALALYESVGFREFGRNPCGCRSRVSGWQTLVLMRLGLE